MSSGAVWGISFDAVPLSGVVVEFLKLVRSFPQRGFAIYLDLGYDVRPDKHGLFAPYRTESELLPDWVQLARIGGLEDLEGYTTALTNEVFRRAVELQDASVLEECEALIDEISRLILQTWEKLGISVVIVENGTLPENIVYTAALYRAIDRYGSEHGLGRFVLWRDHDLMWQSESRSGKYGRPPYPTTPRPVSSPHIQYVALHQDALARTLEWAVELDNIMVLPNRFTIAPAIVTEHNAHFRHEFAIPEHAPLIARCTRIIPQKRIDRDIHLIARLPPDVDAYLFVAGDTDEAPGEHARLLALARTLGVTERVVFGGWLSPREVDVGASAGHRYSVTDLLAHATVSSFLTADDYESYGNPVGEAAASHVPYLTTRYALYDEVYGSKGFRAPVLEQADGDLPDRLFVAEVAELLTDRRLRSVIADTNLSLARRYLAALPADLMLDALRASAGA